MIWHWHFSFEFFLPILYLSSLPYSSHLLNLNLSYSQLYIPLFLFLLTLSLIFFHTSPTLKDNAGSWDLSESIILWQQQKLISPTFFISYTYIFLCFYYIEIQQQTQDTNLSIESTVDFHILSVSIWFVKRYLKNVRPQLFGLSITTWSIKSFKLKKLF